MILQTLQCWLTVTTLAFGVFPISGNTPIWVHYPALVTDHSLIAFYVMHYVQEANKNLFYQLVFCYCYVSFYQSVR